MPTLYVHYHFVSISMSMPLLVQLASRRSLLPFSVMASSKTHSVYTHALQLVARLVDMPLMSVSLVLVPRDVRVAAHCGLWWCQPSVGVDYDSCQHPSATPGLARCLSFFGCTHNLLLLML